MVATKRRLAHRQCSGKQRLRLRVPLQVVESAGKVVETVADQRMSWIKRLLADGKGSAHERLGLRKPALRMQERRQVVQGHRNRRTFRPKPSLAQRQRTAVQG